MSSGSGGEESQMTGLAAQFGFAMPSSSVAQWSYIDVIKSRTLARSMWYRKFDTEKYGSAQQLIRIISDTKLESQEWSEGTKKSVINKLLSNIFLLIRKLTLFIYFSLSLKKVGLKKVIHRIGEF